MKATEAIALAENHVVTCEFDYPSRAETELNDAWRALYAGWEIAAKARALASLEHSVGPFHQDDLAVKGVKVSNPGKFDQVRPTLKTATLVRLELKLDDDLVVMCEQWVQDDIHAESMIFAASDLDSLDDEAIIARVRPYPMVNADSQITLSHSDNGFVFVNFNFVARD